MRANAMVTANPQRRVRRRLDTLPERLAMKVLPLLDIKEWRVIHLDRLTATEWDKVNNCYDIQVGDGTRLGLYRITKEGCLNLERIKLYRQILLEQNLKLRSLIQLKRDRQTVAQLMLLAETSLKAEEPCRVLSDRIQWSHELQVLVTLKGIDISRIERGIDLNVLFERMARNPRCSNWLPSVREVIEATIATPPMPITSA